VPWWRVINHQGRLTISPAHGLRVLQRTLLEQEGVRFRSDDAVDLDRHAWDGPFAES
jgi:methylated-DNA-protein-cysteine methyltransferase-like protein